MQGHLVGPPPAQVGLPGMIVLCLIGAGAVLFLTMAVTLIVREQRQLRVASGATLGDEAERWLSDRPGT